jgi:hypothetical protein
MTDVNAPAIPHDAGASPARFAPLVFSGAIFLSAALLFWVEPLFSKMVLPILGGTSAVWSVAMVVFQGVMLAGYVYAHILTRYLQIRTALLVHLLVLAVATLSLPIAIASGFQSPPQDGPSLWLVGLFLTSIGLPFSRWPRTRHCCRRGLPAGIRKMPICCIGRPISVRFLSCSPIQS